MACVVTWGVRGSLSTQGGEGGGSPGVAIGWPLPIPGGTAPVAPGHGQHRGVSRQLAAVAHLPAGPSSVCFARQQYGSFQMDKLECSQLKLEGQPPAHGPPPEQQLHSEGGDLLYAPSYGLPFSYHYGPSSL